MVWFKTTKENPFADWFKIVFLQFDTNLKKTEQAGTIDVMVARAKRINSFDDESKQVFFDLFSFIRGSSGENESFLFLLKFQSFLSN